MPPSISFRKSIKWGDGETQEPTSTLVLTTSSGHFVDVRMLLPHNFIGDEKLLSGAESTLKIDWAFAGTSESSKTIYEGKERRSCTWTHWIDNLKPSGYQDSGVMWTQEDGTTMEIGKMENPATGREESYQEIWEDPILAPTGKCSHVVCHALKLDNPGSRGLLIRVGDWAQGLRIDEDGIRKAVTIQRLRWSGGKWNIMIQCGHGNLPIQRVVSDTQIETSDFDDWKLLEFTRIKPE